MSQNKHEKRKLWKQNAKAVVKKHYIILVLLCLVSVFYGTEYSYVQEHSQTTFDVISGKEVLGPGTAVTIDGKSLLEVVEEKLGVDIPALRDQKEQQIEMAEKTESSINDKLTEIKGGSRGILSGVANYFSSGKLVDTIVSAGTSIFKSRELVSILLVLASTLVTIFIWIFLKNVYVAVLRRMFLEARFYEKLPASHVLHFRIYGRWIRASLAMFRASLYEILWWFTIVGGVIKRYSYLMVPYIIAENPDIKGKEAIKLSRRMMYGHKWEAFLIDVSFIGWHILGILTFGIAEALWVVPYKTSTFTEFYTDLRNQAKEAGIEGADYLNDTYLFEKADRDQLEEAYIDIEAHKLYIDTHRVTLPPVRAFFAKNLGLWIGSMEEKQEYDAVDNKRQQIVEDRAAIKGELYPHRLNPLWIEDSFKVLHSARSIRTYTIWTIIMVFFIFSFIGWSWEVSLHLVKDGVFVNRGVMHGPWLPVYGSGVVMILLVLARWRRTPVVEAILTIVLCGFVEYMTSWYLEAAKGMRWWDYTGYFLNLDGRICGEGLMVFAIGGMAAVYLLVPLIDTTLSHFNYKGVVAVSLILLAVFCVDWRYSSKHPNVGEGITDYDEYQKSAVVMEYVEPDVPEIRLLA